MTLDTGGACRSLLVLVMSGRVVLGSWMLVAGSTKPIIRELHFGRMWVVAIAATDSLAEHLALYVRTVNINLIHDLTIRMIRFRSQQLIGIVIVQPLPRAKVFVNDTTARMAGSAGLNLGSTIFPFQACQTIAMMTIPKQ